MAQSVMLPIQLNQPDVKASGPSPKARLAKLTAPPDPPGTEAPSQP